MFSDDAALCVSERREEDIAADKWTYPDPVD